MVKYLFIGGLVAAGFDPTGRYLLTVSHSGRGVFETETWQRVARDLVLAYPQNGFTTGIGPIEGQSIRVIEMDYDSGDLHFLSPDGQTRFDYDSGSLLITNS